MRKPSNAVSKLKITLLSPSWWIHLKFSQKCLLISFIIFYLLGLLSYSLAFSYDHYHTVELILEGLKHKINNELSGLISVLTQEVTYEIRVIALVGMWRSDVKYKNQTHLFVNKIDQLKFLENHANVGKDLWETCLYSSINAPLLFYTTMILSNLGLMILLYCLPVGIFNRELMIFLAICGAMSLSSSIIFQSGVFISYIVCIYRLQSGYYRGKLVKTFWHQHYYRVITKWNGYSIYLTLFGTCACFVPMIICGLLLIFCNRKKL